MRVRLLKKYDICYQRSIMNDLDLKRILDRIDHRGYPAYKDTKGRYDFGDYILSIDHVQGDPFAAPSKLSVYIRGGKAGFESCLFDEKHRRIALQDLMLRKFYKAVGGYSFKAGGSGKSGVISVSRPGQEILERSACTIDEKTGDLTVRFRVGFPAKGRTVLAGELVKILYVYLPECIKKALYSSSYDKQELKNTADLADDQKYIRESLEAKGLKAFVADGSVLPRKSGVSDIPMKDACLFRSPESLAVEMELPHKGTIRGMGIPKGICLIVGGGYHGKSTLLKALETGVYDHIKGDGREYVITDPTAMKLRAEDGRSIQNTDISMFIRNLPNGKDTRCFSTEDASGSTSQAAGTVEAIEAGSKLLLIDEDTSATNFMIRDELMQRVVHADEEPIIPFIDRVKDLYGHENISTILVAGSSGSYFHKADTVIQMKEYLPYDITQQAKEAASHFPPHAGTEDTFTYNPPKRYVNAGKGLKYSDRIKMKSFGTDGFSVNREDVELRFVEQLADTEQTGCLANILVYMMTDVMDGKKTVYECVEYVHDRLQKESFKGIRKGNADDLAMPRKQEIYAMLNRCRGLVIKN